MGGGADEDRRAAGGGMTLNKKPGALSQKAATKSLTDAEGRLFGLPLRPNAHAFAHACREIVEAAGFVDADSYRLAFHQDDGDTGDGDYDDTAEQLPKTVSVPVMLLTAVAELLSMMPGPSRGRPLKASNSSGNKTNANEIQSRGGETCRGHHRRIPRADSFEPQEPKEAAKASHGHKATPKKGLVKKDLILTRGETKSFSPISRARFSAGS